MDELTQAKRVLEAALLASHEPLPLDEIIKVFEPPVPTETVRLLLADLAAEWKQRGSIELVQVASGYRFQTRGEMQVHIDRLSPQKPPRYSRAVLETLAIIAYRQPATRGEIEAIRGVAVSSHILKALEDRGWVEVIGHKDTPGRPALYATTKAFLNDLALRSLSELPPLAELDAHPALELPEVPQEPVYPEQTRIEGFTEAGSLASESSLFESEANEVAALPTPPTVH
ncbi:MAG: SMC-Scp complex subunit ScpB [Burkholderiales bacterium]|nr:SMC-Scp complex subunit ScpB [Pseudomonadota bacterium]MCC7069485.1 SMC-Scp complex subunit ScpB [Burkholderiales bacterium]